MFWRDILDLGIPRKIVTDEAIEGSLVQMQMSMFHEYIIFVAIYEIVTYLKQIQVQILRSKPNIINK